MAPRQEHFIVMLLGFGRQRYAPQFPKNYPVQLVVVFSFLIYTLVFTRTSVVGPATIR